MSFAKSVPDAAGPSNGPFEDPNKIFAEMATMPTRGRRLPAITRKITVLSFKLFTTTPLLLVSKEIRAEVQDFLQLFQPGWQSMVESTIHLHRIISPCSAFLDICSRSRFVFNDTSPSTLWFLDNTPDCMKPCIRDIVITRKCLAGGRSAIDAWDRYGYGGHYHSEFTSLLRGRCKSLHKVALEIPKVAFSKYVVESAIGGLLTLLRDGVVNSVHFMQSRDGHGFSHAKFISEVLDELSGFSNEPITDTAEIVPRVFDVLEESGDSLKPWANHSFDGGLRITRFADTQLGTPTISRQLDKT
jgi:hypothetical protein